MKKKYVDVSMRCVFCNEQTNSLFHNKLVCSRCKKVFKRLFNIVYGQETRFNQTKVEECFGVEK
jgi:tRNA(Ile2) C34 agmatinyltransferase TiaS